MRSVEPHRFGRGILFVTTPSTSHFEAALQRDTDLIRTKVLEMAALDEQALTKAFQAFVTRDRQLAYSVILCDQDVDALETELDRLCLAFIVRHQPAAGHLRFVYSASKIVNELERIGDYAESIARQVLVLGSLKVDVSLDQFSEMANLAIPMLHNAVRAFVDRNADLARTTMEVEPLVNEVRDSLSTQLVEWREQGLLPLEALPPLINVARRFERVSDQATNICEEALYFATGEYLRHLPRAGFGVLFVDETNGCLSRLAEAIGNGLGVKRFSFASAGLTAGPVDPQTIRFLAEKGVDISHQPSRSVDAIPQLDQVQVIVSLCKGTARSLPQRPAKKTVGLDWILPDPSKARGTTAEVRAVYEQAYQTLSANVRDLVEAILGKDERQSHADHTSAL
jgi:phosphate transport system protein